MDQLVSGYGLLEAPRVDSDGGLLFSDVLGGGVHRRSPTGEVETVVSKRRGVGGLVPHRDGGVVVSGRTVAHCRDGETRDLLALDGVTGFNDMTTDREGRVIVGALRFHPFKGEEPVPGEIWRIEPGRAATRLCSDVRWPNGIGLSPDSRTLYVDDYADGSVWAYELGGDPPLDGRVFAWSPGGSADGLAVDEEGGVWIALGDGGGVARFDPDGALDRAVDVPASFVSSLSFGGPDRRDLYVTTADPGCIFRTRSDVAGLPVEPAAV